MPFDAKLLDDLPGLLLVEPRVFADARGWFKETYQRSAFRALGLPDLVQDNVARNTSRGVLRGLHYQRAPAAQGKLVACTLGEVFDVAVDLRRGSPTYGRWVGLRLAAEEHRMLWVPRGFAHGYCTLSDVSEVAYKVDVEWSPAHERAIRWDDPALGIRWPVARPLLSPKDAAAPPLAEADHDFLWEG